MEIRIIAEGKTDVIIIKNILKGKLSIDTSEIKSLLPEDTSDNTDLQDHNINKNKFSNWELVKEECCLKEKIRPFLNSPILDERIVIIQIDTDQIEHKNFGLTKPKKDKNNLEEYSETLVNLVKDKMKEWLENEFIENIRFAIAVEEIEAWVLTIYKNYLQNTKDTSCYENSKEKLKLLEAKLNKLSFNNEKEKYKKLTKDFTKSKKLKECIKHNKSLEIFYNSI